MCFSIYRCNMSSRSHEQRLTSLCCGMFVSFVCEVLFLVVALFLLLITTGVGVAETAAGSSGAVFNCRISSSLVMASSETGFLKLYTRSELRNEIVD